MDSREPRSLLKGHAWLSPIFEGLLEAAPASGSLSPPQAWIWLWCPENLLCWPPPGLCHVTFPNLLHPCQKKPLLQGQRPPIFLLFVLGLQLDLLPQQALAPEEETAAL